MRARIIITVMAALFLLTCYNRVYADWQKVTVDSSGDTGYYSSIAIDKNGIPYISYYDNTDGVLKLARTTGGTWITQVVDNNGNVGMFTSLALDSNGMPHISYQDVTNHSLKYAYFDGTQWHTQTIDITGSTGYSTAMTIDTSDEPHIVYYEINVTASTYPLYKLRDAYEDSTNTWHTEDIGYSVFAQGAPSITLDQQNHPIITLDDGAIMEYFYNGYGMAQNVIEGSPFTKPCGGNCVQEPYGNMTSNNVPSAIDSSGDLIFVYNHKIEYIPYDGFYSGSFLPYLAYFVTPQTYSPYNTYAFQGMDMLAHNPRSSCMKLDANGLINVGYLEDDFVHSPVDGSLTQILELRFAHLQSNTSNIIWGSAVESIKTPIFITTTAFNDITGVSLALDKTDNIYVSYAMADPGQSHRLVYAYTNPPPLTNVSSQFYDYNPVIISNTGKTGLFISPVSITTTAFQTDNLYIEPFQQLGFSITKDTCSNNTLLPSGQCFIWLKFTRQANNPSYQYMDDVEVLKVPVAGGNLNIVLQGRMLFTDGCIGIDNGCGGCSEINNTYSGLFEILILLIPFFYIVIYSGTMRRKKDKFYSGGLGCKRK